MVTTQKTLTAKKLADMLKADRKLGKEHIKAGSEILDVETISTSIPTLDYVLGQGGIPRARMLTFSGPEGGGKTTAAFAAIAGFQRAGGIGLYIDAECKLNRDWAQKNGVDVDSLIVVTPPHLERAFRIARRAINEATPETPLLVVLDSVNASPTKKVVTGDFEDDNYAPTARTLSKSIPMVLRAVEKSHATFLFISQLRQKMDATITIAGGFSVRYYSCAIVVFDHAKQFTPSGESRSKVWSRYKEQGKRPPKSAIEAVGIDCSVSSIKNQNAPPFREGKLRIRFASGVDRKHAFYESALDLGVIKVSGSWYSVGEFKAHGEQRFLQLLKRKPEAMKLLRREVRKAALR